MKWCRQYERPYLIIKTPFFVAAKIQRTAKMTAKTVHIDKLKAYLGTPLRSWLFATTNDGNRTENHSPVTSPISPDMLIGSIMPPSTGQQTMPRPVSQRQIDVGKQRDLGAGRPSFALPTYMKSAVESKSSKPDNSSVQWDADLTPVSGEIVTDAQAFDHVTTSAAVVGGEGKSEETTGRPLPVPTEVQPMSEASFPFYLATAITGRNAVSPQSFSDGHKYNTDFVFIAIFGIRCRRSTIVF